MSHDVGVFISHSWSHTNHYATLAEWLFETSWNVSGTPLRFVDYSIPQDNPIHNANNDRELAQAIANEIGKAHVVVCPTGMYANYSKWIEPELIGARNMGRRILGVNPWGQKRRSSVVESKAHNTVGWTKQSVVNGVWNLFRGM